MQPTPYYFDEQPASQGNPASGSAVDVSIGGVLWRRKGLMLFLVLLGLGGGYWFFTTQEETFRAEATIEVRSEKASTDTGSAVEGITETAPGLPFVQAEITSDQVLQRAIEIGQLTALESTPSADGPMMSMIRSNLVLGEPFEGAGGGGGRTIVAVSFEANDPTVATAIVNAVVEAYDDYVNGRHEKSIEKVVGFFRDGRESIMPKLEELEKEFTEFRSTAPLEWTSTGEAVNPFREEAIRIEGEVRTFVSQARQLQNKMRLIQDASKSSSSPYAALQEVQYLLDDVRDIGEMQRSIIEAPDSDLELQTKLMGLNVRADLLATQLAPNHPVRIAVEDELRITEKALRSIQERRESNSPVTVDVESRQDEAAKAILNTYISGLKKKIQLVEDEKTDSETRLEDVRDRALKLIAYENENASFLRRIARYQSMLDSFDSQLEKATLPHLDSGLRVTVLRPAGLGYLVGPLLSRALVLGGFLGLVMGAALAFLLDFSERTFRNPDEVSRLLGLPILTHLPVMVGRPKSKKGEAEGNQPFPSIDPIVSVLHDPHSATSEAFRSVRTTLFSTPNAPAEYQVIQVTSALPGDGKSTVVANLAASVARANKRVLVIDADLRRPTQSKIFGINRAQGLTSVLNGELELDDAIVETEAENTFLLPSGPKPNNPAEALMLREFEQLLDDARERFDLILVDTPPLLSVTDASNVATRVDGVVLTMRIGRNCKPMSKRSLTLLKMLHVNVVGVIINAIGDSGYSATYGQAWSTSYGGQPGSEYGYSYYRYGSDRYLDASKGQSVTVRGKSAGKSSTNGSAKAAKINGTHQPSSRTATAVVSPEEHGESGEE